MGPYKTNKGKCLRNPKAYPASIISLTSLKVRSLSKAAAGFESELFVVVPDFTKEACKHGAHKSFLSDYVLGEALES